MSPLNNVSNLREHINSPNYFMTCCTISQAIGELYFLALKKRGLMPKLSEVRNLRELKFWAIGYLILNVEH